MADVEDDLLPGIVKAVTLTHIAPHLSWATLRVLASVSRTWQRAIQNREVYDERARTGLQETLVVVKHRHAKSDRLALSLYSMTKETFYGLPPIPHSLGGISQSFQFHISNGTLYIMGAGCHCRCSDCTNYSTEPALSSYPDANRMFMLDLAGMQERWEDCSTSVLLLRLNRRDTLPINCGSITVGDDIFKRSGCPCWFTYSWFKFERDDRWRMVQSDSEQLKLDRIPQQWFLAEGERYHTVTRGNYLDLFSQDAITGLPIHVHSISSAIEPSEGSISYPIQVEPLFILPLNNELLAIAHWSDVLTDGYCMIQSIGFGSARKEIEWQKVIDSTHFLDRRATFAMCPIQL